MKWTQDKDIDGQPLKYSWTVFVGDTWWVAGVNRARPGVWHSITIHDGELESYQHRSKAAAQRAAEKRLRELFKVLKIALTEK